MTFPKTVAAVIVGIVLLQAAALGGLFLKFGRGPSLKKDSILVQDLRGPMLEYPVGGFTSGILAPDELTLHQVLESLSKAAADKRISGVVLTLGSPGAGYGMLEEVRAEVQKVREAGKPVWAWTDAVTLKDLYVASACDSLFVFPTANVNLGGIYSERLFLAGMLQKLGIQLQMNRIERYKSAAEMMQRNDMSPESREMARWILQDLYPRIINDTVAGLGCDHAVLNEAMEEGLLFPEDLERMRLIHGIRDWHEMRRSLPRPRGKDEPRLLTAEDYGDVEPGDVGIKGKKTIAVVHAQGLIGGTKSGRDPLFGVVMGHQSVNSDLRTVLADEDIVAVVFRVDSRGGSSLTSDRISRMVGAVDREKPVVVSMVDVAASGGYSVSYRARTLVANRNTITGSIGSITGKFAGRDFYNKLGISKDGVGMGPNSNFYSDYRPWTPQEYDRMARDHWRSYHAWITRIAKHRGVSPAEVDSVARGRVWTGSQALERRLVDRIGNLNDALTAAKEAAGLDTSETVTLVHYPKPKGMLSQLLGVDVSAAPDVVLNRWLNNRLNTAHALSAGDLDLLDMGLPE